MTYAFIHSMKFILITLFLLISFFASTGTRAQAYFTTSQSATPLDNHTGLFLIEYSFGVPGHALHLPVSARNTGDASRDAVSFSMLDDQGERVDGKIASIVFSNATLERNGMYFVPKNVAKKFTLAVVFTPTTPNPSEKYRLQVTHLPFDFDGTQQLQLNPSELKYYTTKLISL